MCDSNIENIEIRPALLVYFGDKNAKNNDNNYNEYMELNEEINFAELLKEHKERYKDYSALGYTPTAQVIISNIKFNNKVNFVGDFENITFRNLIFEDEVSFSATFRGEFLFQNIIFKKEVCFDKAYFRYNEYMVSNKRTEFGNVRFEGNVDFKGINLEGEYQEFIFGNTNFTYKPKNLKHILLHEDFNRQVDIINNRNYN